MDFKPGFLGKWLTGSGDWRASIGRDTFIWESEGTEPSEYALPTIRVIEVRNGFIWSTVNVEAGRSTITLRGISRTNSTQLKLHLGKAVSQSVSRLISPSAKLIANIFGELEKFYRQPRYLANRDAIVWTQSLASGINWQNWCLKYNFRVYKHAMTHYIFNLR